MPQFPHLIHESNNCTYLIRLLSAYKGSGQYQVNKHSALAKIILLQRGGRTSRTSPYMPPFPGSRSLQSILDWMVCGAGGAECELIPKPAHPRSCKPNRLFSFREPQPQNRGLSRQGGGVSCSAPPSGTLEHMGAGRRGRHHPKPPAAPARNPSTAFKSLLVVCIRPK